jgi:hypothetical protein
MNLLLRGLSLVNGLPFADSPPPDLLVSIFWQLWEDGSGGGGLSESVSLETPPNVDVGDIAGMGVEVVEGRVEEKEAREEIVEVKDVVKEGDGLSIEDEMAMTGLTMASISSGSGQCYETLRAAHPSCEMTATPQIDTRWEAGPITSPTWHFEFDFGDTFVDVSKPSRTRTRPHPLPRPTRGAAGHHAKQEEPAAAHWSHTSSTCWHTTQALHSQWVM